MINLPPEIIKEIANHGSIKELYQLNKHFKNILQDLFFEKCIFKFNRILTLLYYICKKVLTNILRYI